jgi:eukaryotic-like serine/threonine-protein kinase
VTRPPLPPTVRDGYSPAPTPHVDAHAQQGRFRITGTLGAGGMGVVLAAHDPDLDRQVAIKLLHPESDGTSNKHSMERLAREARAMARLAHPNVVTVYEVGTIAGRTFIAMELIEGTTLRRWIDERRGWRDVVPMLVAAGRGLAAAHRAGLVHRDFKPDNVLIGVDGRPRVTDFGLVTDARPAFAIGSGPRDVTPRLETQDTSPMTAGLAGTPAYMPPEQWKRTSMGPYTDQFAFCVALWEALYGERPFKGELPVELRDSICHGAIRGPSARGDVPAWLESALRRGLAVDPERRWPDLEALLDLIERKANPWVSSRRRWAAAAAGVVVLGSAGGWWIRDRSVTTAEGDVCAVQPDRFAELWNDSSEQTVRDSILATKTPFADDTFREVKRQLDAGHQSWLAMQVDNCHATRRGEQSDAMMDLRAACLVRRLDDVRAFLDQLGTADVDTVRLAVQQAGAVGDFAVCADAAALARRAPMPADPGVRQRIDALNAELAAARAKIAAGRHRQAVEETEALAVRARTVGYAPVLADALHVAALVQEKSDKGERAKALLEEAVLAAEAGGDDVQRFDCEVRLMGVVGQKLELPDEAARHGQRAEALLERLGPDVRRSGSLAIARASLAWHAGRFEEAAPLAQAAVDHYEKLDPAGLDLARALHLRAIIENEQHRDHQAAATEERAIAIAEQRLGTEHPTVANFLMTRGNAFRRLDRLADARAAYQRSLAILETFYGPEASIVASANGNLATVYMDEERYEDAIPLLRRAYAMHSKAMGPDHSYVALAAELLGSALSKGGHAHEAEPLLLRAVEINTKRQGASAPITLASHCKLGEHHLRHGHPAAARDAFTKVVRAIDAAEPASRSDRVLATALVGLGDAGLALNDKRAARRAFERALATLGGGTGDEELRTRAAAGLVAVDSQ